MIARTKVIGIALVAILVVVLVILGDAMTSSNRRVSTDPSLAKTKIPKLQLTSAGTENESITQTMEGIERADQEQVPNSTLLTIIGSKNSQPIPYAKVYLFHSPQEVWPDLKRRQLPGVREAGTLFLCDEKGKVRLPHSNVPMVITGRAPGYSGQRVFKGLAKDELTIILYPSKTLQVHVKDENGNPLSRCLVALEKLPRPSSSWHPLAYGLTDEQGDLILSTGLSEREGDFAVRLCAGLEKDPMALVNDHHWNGQTISLTLEQPGEVWLSIQAKDLHPLEDQIYTLTIYPTNKEVPNYGPYSQGGSFLTLGKSFHIRTSSFGGGLSVKAANESGSRKSGVQPLVVPPPHREIQQALSVKCDQPWAVGNFHFADGTAASDLRVSYYEMDPETGYRMGRRSRLQTTEAGDFLIPLAPFPGGPPRMNLLFSTSQGKDIWESSAALQGKVLHGIHDLGPLLLRKAPHILSGTVSDSSGRLIAKAKLKLFPPDSGQSQSDWTAWSLRSDAEGYFSFFGSNPPPPGTPLTLQVSHEGFVDTTLSVRTQREVSVQLNRLTKVFGRVLLPEGLPSAELSLQVNTLDGESSSSSHFISVSQEGLFDIDLPPGSFEISPRANEAPLFSKTQRFSIAPGKERLDLPTIDLRSGYALATIIVRAEGATKGPQPRVYLGESNQSDHSRLIRVNQSHSILFSIQRPEVTIEANGFVSQTVDLIEGENLIMLKKAIGVQVEIPSLPKLPYGLTFYCVLTDQISGQRNYLRHDGEDGFMGFVDQASNYQIELVLFNFQLSGEKSEDIVIGTFPLTPEGPMQISEGLGPHVLNLVAPVSEIRGAISSATMQTTEEQ